jgi:hypothetical protein
LNADSFIVSMDSSEKLENDQNNIFEASKYLRESRIILLIDKM